MGDHLVEMMTPTQTWGQEFLAAAVVTRQAGDIFRILGNLPRSRMTTECVSSIVRLRPLPPMLLG